jgi:hypothetical protein
MEEKVIKLNVDLNGVEEAEKKSQSLKARLKELKAELAGLDEGSAEFHRLAEEAGALQDAIGDVNQRVKNLSSDTRGLDALMDGMQGVTGAFAAGEGAIALFGGESEQLQETMLKVQSAIALTSGVQSVANAINKDSALMTQLSAYWTNIKASASLKSAAATGVETTATVGMTSAMRILNAVIKANPIMWLITGITALVGAVAWFVSEEEKAEEQNEALNKSIAKTSKEFENRTAKLEKNLSHEIEMMKLRGATDEELFKAEMSRLETLQKNRLIGTKQIEDGLKSKRQILKQAVKEENEELIKKINDELKAEKDKWNNLKQAEGDYYRNKEILIQQEKNRKKEEREEEVKKEKEKQKQINDNYKKALEEKAAIRRRIEDINASLIEDETKRLITQENLRFQREYNAAKGHKDLLIALEKQHAANIEKIRSDQTAKEVGEMQKTLDAMNAHIKARNAAQSSANETIVTQKAEVTEKQNKLDEWNALSAEEREKRKLDAVSGTLTAIGQLTELFAGKSRKQQERAFKIQKGVATAQALIDTYKAANAAFSSMASIPVVGSVLGAIAAAGAIAAGIVNVKKIQSQQFEGGGGSASGGSAPSINIPQIGNQVTAPQVGAQNTTGISQLPEQAPVKAYVVTSEVTTGQSLERNKVADATL